MIHNALLDNDAIDFFNELELTLMRQERLPPRTDECPRLEGLQSSMRKL